MLLTATTAALLPGETAVGLWGALPSVFEFYVISTKPYQPPTWIRLGKWMSKAALKVNKTEEVDQIRQGDYAGALPIWGFRLEQCLSK
jgi:hypothetical protein